MFTSTVSKLVIALVVGVWCAWLGAPIWLLLTTVCGLGACLNPSGEYNASRKTKELQTPLADDGVRRLRVSAGLAVRIQRIRALLGHDTRTLGPISDRYSGIRQRGDDQAHPASGRLWNTRI